MAAEARVLGHGGVRAVARAAAVSETTVRKGVFELEAGEEPLGRVRRRSQTVAELDPGLRRALLAPVEPEVRGDPMSPLRWTLKSTRALAGELTRAGHRVSADAPFVPGLRDADRDQRGDDPVLGDHADEPSAGPATSRRPALNAPDASWSNHPRSPRRSPSTALPRPSPPPTPRSRGPPQCPWPAPARGPAGPEARSGSAGCPARAPTPTGWRPGRAVFTGSRSLCPGLRCS